MPDSSASSRRNSVSTGKHAQRFLARRRHLGLPLVVVVVLLGALPQARVRRRPGTRRHRCHRSPGNRQHRGVAQQRRMLQWHLERVASLEDEAAEVVVGEDLVAVEAGAVAFVDGGEARRSSRMGCVRVVSRHASCTTRMHRHASRRF